jgi:SAM-dependent methyltransferase
MKAPRDFAAEQAAFWNGAGGKAWLAAYGRIERSIASFSEVVLVAADAKPGEHAIDVGCGTGDTTAELARRVAPGGSVLGVDISEVLIAAGRQRDVPRTAFEVGDATHFPFASATFDLVFSRFGVMFFADPVAAFKNLRRAAKPDGRLVFICWRTAKENPWALVPIQAAMPHLPPFERPGPEDPGQNSFGDRARVTRILEAAGFTTPSFEAIDRPVTIGKDVADTIENLAKFGPLARAFATADARQVTAAKDALAVALAPHAGAEGVVLSGACWLVQAKVVG